MVLIAGVLLLLAPPHGSAGAARGVSASRATGVQRIAPLQRGAPAFRTGIRPFLPLWMPPEEVVEPEPPLPPEQAPPAIYAPAAPVYTPEKLHPEMTEYAPGALAEPRRAAVEPPLNGPGRVYFKDGTVEDVSAWRYEENTLFYITTRGRRTRVTLDLVDDVK